MKLIIKVRSPFLFIATLLFLLSCTDDKSNYLNLNIENINKAIKAQDNAMRFDSLNALDSAFNYYSKASALYALGKDSLRTAYPMLRMAQIQYSKSDYFGSESTATEALPYVMASKDTTFQREFYNILGMSNRKLLNYDKALQYYQKANYITKDSISKCIILNNIASIYVDKHDYINGLNIYTKLEKSDTIINNQKEKARVFHNLGDIYRLTDNSIAPYYFKEAIFLRNKVRDLNGLTSSYNKIAEYYQNKDNSLAKDYTTKAYTLANRLKLPEEKLDALKRMISLYNGDVSKRYAMQYVILKDSVDKVKQMAKKEFAMIKYDSKTALENIKELEVTNKIESQRNAFKIRLIIIISVFTILFSLLLLYVNKLKHKKEKLQQVYITETRISKVIHDELANDMFNIMTFAETENFSLPEQQQKLIHNLDVIYNKTRDISKENNAIDTGLYFDRVLKEMLSEYNARGVSVILVNYENVNWKSLAEHKKIAVYRVLQEIMVNMKKHSNATNVIIRFIASGKNISIQYADNGVGINEKQLHSKNGLQNAENRILSISGNISFDKVNEKGLKIIIAFPA